VEFRFLKLEKKCISVTGGFFSFFFLLWVIKLPHRTAFRLVVGQEAVGVSQTETALPVCKVKWTSFRLLNLLMVPRHVMKPRRCRSWTLYQRSCLAKVSRNFIARLAVII